MTYDELPDVLNVQDLMAYLRVGRDAAYRIAKEIPHFKNGNRVLVPKENLRKWMIRQSENRSRIRLRTVK